jgi:hypothetical protein
MSDDRSGKPEFPMRGDDSSDVTADGRPGDADAPRASNATPPLPEIPAWQPPASPPQPERAPETRDLTPDRPEAVVEETVIEEPASADAARDISADGATRPPSGGPYVVTGSGAPVAEQAVIAYEREPIGGPYVTPSEPATATAAEPAPAPAPVGTVPYGQYQPAPVTAPSAPRPPAAKGNRAGGSVISLLGTVVFAVVFAAVSFVVINANLSGAAGVAAWGSFLASAAFIVPVVVFAISLILIVLIVNRAGWWAYVLGGFLVALLVYVAGIAGALVHVQAWTWPAQEQYDFVRSLVMDPLTLAGAIVAREASIWTGAWIAARGRKVKAANATARADWERAEAGRQEPAPPATW